MTKEDSPNCPQGDSPPVKIDPPRKKWMANVKVIVKELLMFVPAILVAIGIYFYLIEQAKPFTPPEGHVFPREPVLEGIYRLEHHQGRNATASYVGDTPITCGVPAYYLATPATSFGSYDCGLDRELSGKLVLVERVRVPTKNKEVGDFAVRITHHGRDYRHLSGESVRRLWISGTQQDASSTASYIWIALLFLQLCFTYKKEILSELRRNKK